MVNAWRHRAMQGAIALFAALGVGSASAEQMNLREFGQADGLQNLSINALAQDAPGLLWAGTDNGLYRHDGARIVRVGSSEIRSVTSLAAGGANLWISSQSRLWLWREGRLRSAPLPKDTEIGVYAQSLAAVDDEAWLTTDKGLLHVSFDPTAGTLQTTVARTPEQLGVRLNRPLQVFSALRDCDGSLWLGCGEAICRLRGDVLTQWAVDRGVPDRREWSSLLQAEDGSIWARARGALIQLVDPAGNFADRTPPGTRDDAMNQYPLVQDASGRVLTASQEGLLRWNGQGWALFGRHQGLPGDGRLIALMSDREGELWMGLRGTGLLHWQGYGRWVNWSAADGLPNDVVWSILRVGGGGGRTGAGDLYVSTGRGVGVFDPKAERFRQVALRHKRDISQLVPDGEGGLWGITPGGALHRIRDRRAQGVPIAPRGPEDGFLRAMRARDGAFWLMTTQQTLRWPQGPVGQPQVLPGPRGQAKSFEDLCDTDDRTVWMAGWQGVASQRDDVWSPQVPMKEGAGMLACLADGTVMAVSGYGELWHLRRDGSTPKAERIASPALEGRQVMSILADSRRWLWFGTDAGLVVWNGTQWKVLDQSHGLIGNDTSGFALYEDSDSSLWVGTSRGLSHLVDPSAVFAKAIRPPLLLSALHGSDPRPVRDGEALPWSQDRFHLLLAPAQFSDPSLRIEYRLAGRDELWFPAPHAEIELTGLAPGSYQIEARSADPDSGVRSQPISFSFTLDPPWWATGRARALGLLLLLGLIYGIHRWRRRQWKHQQLRLEAVVRERTQALEDSRAQLEVLASRDALTGVWNRRALLEVLDREVTRAGRERLPLSVVIIDIDHFKRVNDTYGHPAGDAVLRTFAERLSGEIRPYDAVGRLGGEEFMLVLPGMDLNEAADRERLCRMQVEVNREPTAIGRVTSSFGAAMFGGALTTGETLLEAADQALYRAKNSGRNRVAFHEDVPCDSPRADDRAQLTERLEAP
ncbi:diguanylate cyclase [Roseateles sp. UC29_93]|uniref:ligand-binding sensor domain-containing diguanylate cyclase n=1 Tax=Roseateles sp. UC29_93 TaxID=3350177 RepID=UPI00366C9C1F